MESKEIENLNNSWTACVRLKNGKDIVIWYTCWHSIKHIVDNIVWIASDYPRHKLI
jgi:hypothetical protein